MNCKSYCKSFKIKITKKHDWPTQFPRWKIYKKMILALYLFVYHSSDGVHRKNNSFLWSHGIWYRTALLNYQLNNTRFFLQWSLNERKYQPLRSWFCNKKKIWQNKNYSHLCPNCANEYRDYYLPLFLFLSSLARNSLF